MSGENSLTDKELLAMTDNQDPQYGAARPSAADMFAPPKSFVATWLFAWLLGVLAIDRFYLGKVGTGLLKLFTLGGFGLWWLIDLILVLAGAQTDKNGRALAGYEENKKLAWIVTATVFVISSVFSALSSVVANT
jgi:TM2 domain-containing membrane protein YozV